MTITHNVPVEAVPCSIGGRGGRRGDTRGAVRRCRNRARRRSLLRGSCLLLLLLTGGWRVQPRTRSSGSRAELVDRTARLQPVGFSKPWTVLANRRQRRGRPATQIGRRAGRIQRSSRTGSQR